MNDDHVLCVGNPCFKPVNIGSQDRRITWEYRGTVCVSARGRVIQFAVGNTCQYGIAQKKQNKKRQKTLDTTMHY